MSYQQKQDQERQIAHAVARQVEFVVENSVVTVITPHVIQIVKDGITSSVRIREDKKGNGYVITHNGRGSYYEDVHCKKIGWIVDGVVNIDHAKMKKIAKINTPWDNANISDGIADNFNYREEVFKEHPSIHYVRPHSKNGIGISVDISVPNTEEWEKRKSSNSTKYAIPSGKTVMKIISETPEIDFQTDDRNNINVIGTPEVVMKVISRIAGNPLVDW